VDKHKISTKIERFEGQNIQSPLYPFVFFRPFGCESLGRFHASFQYLLELCYLFCHIVAKGLLERHDHVKCQSESFDHAYDSRHFSYDCYEKFLVHEGCSQIFVSLVQFLQQADDRRMRLLDLLPSGTLFRDDPTYKSCLFIANQVQDTLFLLKETFKNVFSVFPEQLNSRKGIELPNPFCFFSDVVSNDDKYRFKSREFDDKIRFRHNQLPLLRSIYDHGGLGVSEEAFQSFKRFVDPYFILHFDGSGSNPRSMHDFFSHLKRSIYSLEMGHVCSFSTGLFFSVWFILRSLIVYQVRLNHSVSLQFFSLFVAVIIQTCCSNLI
jgi:hypothetical protein